MTTSTGARSAPTGPTIPGPDAPDSTAASGEPGATLVPAGPPAVEARDVSIGYDGRLVVDHLDLAVAPGEMVALLGPSGSGKTTILSALAGFIPIRSGEIALGGRLVAGSGRHEPPERRDVAFVFQGYALWPHLSAIETVAYPIRRRGLGSGEARRQAGDILERLGIARLADRRPAELSGGEQQRVGLGRALAREAPLYLFDEPTAHVDADLRDRLQAEIADHRRRSGAAAIYATHDTAEALALADRVILVRAGRIVQAGSPASVYERPVDMWAARLTGPAWAIRVHVVDARDGHATIDLAGSSQRVELAGPEPASGGEAEAIVRPDWVRFGGDLQVRVDEVAFRGTHSDYRVSSPVGSFGLRVMGLPTVRRGATVGCTVDRLWLLATQTTGDQLPADPPS
jgi:ABC-type Fe3+/spermidine/putrescine transport system ATPase subunit